MKLVALKKLNPLNSIFGRLFIWFWITTIVMIIGTVLIMRQVINSNELQAIPAPEQRQLNEIAESLQSRLIDIPAAQIPKTIRRLSRENRSIIIVLDKQENKLIHNMPGLPLPFEQRFKNLSTASNAYGFMVKNRVFFGPVSIVINDKQYAVFTGKPLRLPMLQHNRDVLAVMAFTISGILCFILAWSFTRPIKRLREAAAEMASGNLQAGTAQITHRQDEIGELSKEFQTMSHKVNEQLENQKRLLADISHELRSPLARLQLAIGIAQQNIEATDNNVSDGTTPDAKKTHMHVQLMERIEKEAHQIDAMIGKVLQLSRLESNVQQIEKQKVIFPSFIESTLQDASYEAENTGKQLIVTALPQQHMVLEPQLIASAIENVLRNAIKFSNQTVEFSAKISGHRLIINISDDGPGVREVELDKLFQPFYRVSAARNRESGGTGLGLAIATQAINAHNGSIKARNNKKGGLNVEISMPISED